MTRIAAALVVLLTAGVAGADDAAPMSMLGVRIDVGTLPLADRSIATYGIGVGVEHPAFCKFRVFGEYEWLWLSSTSSSSAMPELAGTGQRAHVGIRHALLAKTWRRGFRLYVDGELGGGFALTNDNTTGTHALAHGLAGLRLGYDIIQHGKAFEAEFLFRGLVVDRHVGLMFGVGLLWGS